MGMKLDPSDAFAVRRISISHEVNKIDKGSACYLKAAKSFLCPGFEDFQYLQLRKCATSMHLTCNSSN